MPSRQLLVLPALAAALAGCAAPLSEIVFEPHEIDTGFAGDQTVLTGSLFGGAVADVVVVSTDAGGERRLDVRTFDGDAWRPALETALRAEVLSVDVARIDGRDRLITCERGRVSWLDPKSGVEHALVTLPAHDDPPAGSVVPHVDISRDLNDDGRDDLVVPDSGGFQVSVQRPDGTFAAPVKIGSAAWATVERHRVGYRSDPWADGRIHEVDFDRDGRRDLVYWNDDHFVVHRQDERGEFAAPPATFTTVVAFDSGDRDSLVAPGEVSRRLKDQALTGRQTGSVLHSLADMNGDAIADLVVFALKGPSLWGMHSAYAVHFGGPAPDGGTAFPAVADTVIETDGIPFAIGEHDFDGDGGVDVAFTTIDPQIFMMVGALLTRTIPMNLEFHRLEDGAYPDRLVRRRTKADSLGRLGEEVSHFPTVLIGDVSGDGRADLLVGRSGQALHVLVGVPGPDLFDRQARRLPARMPRTDAEHAWLVDLDRDGRQDVLLHHPSTTEPQRVVVLLAR